MRLSREETRDAIVAIMTGGGVIDSEQHAEALERADEIIDLVKLFCVEAIESNMNLSIGCRCLAAETLENA